MQYVLSIGDIMSDKINGIIKKVERNKMNSFEKKNHINLRINGSKMYDSDSFHQKVDKNCCTQINQMILQIRKTANTSKANI